MMRLTPIKKRIIILFSSIILMVVVFICLFSFFKPGAQNIYPVNGLLDLQNWDGRRDGILNLSGGWDFYWQRFLSHHDVATGSPATHVTVEVPSVWNSYKINGQNLPGFGFGTYLLKVVNAPVGKALALRIPVFATAYELYIDDRLVSSNGKAAKDKENFLPQFKPQEVEFTPVSKNFEIIIRVANFTYAQGGMCYTINLGTAEQIRSMVKTIADRDLFLFGALIITIFYYLIFFSLLQRDDKSGLYFVLICILLAGLTAISGDFLIYRLIPSISFEAIMAIYYIVLCWIWVCVAFANKEIFPEENSKQVLRAVLVYTAGMTLLILLTPISFYSRLFYIIITAAFLIGGYCIFTSTVAFLRGKKSSLTILLGMLTVIVCGVHDIFFHSNASHLGIIIVLLIQFFLLARTFAETFKSVNELSQKLLKLDKIKDEFLANTSHELRTPLNGILAITETMLRGSEGEINDSQKRSLALIAGSGRRLANLVNDLLDYSKLKHGDIRLNIKPIRTDGLIMTVVDVFQQLSKSKEIEILADLPAGMPAVLADENRVVQILYNLLGNAVKFTTRGYIEVSAQVSGSVLEICVKDTGEGIPAEKLADIFKSFEQVDTSLTRKYGGTGLGLSITKHLVELHGGGIRVKSDPGKGSAFYFTLPLAKESAPENVIELALPELAVTVIEESMPPIKKEAAKGGQLLLVDDDPVNLQATPTLLRIGGFGVTAVNSGKAALEELSHARSRARDYSLVILDVMMPEMSGYEVCQKIREHKNQLELPVLMLTAKTAVSDIIVGFKAGANDYLAKPFEPDELLARVRTLVNLKMSVDKTVAAELAFMQAQIKPHFLYNTLNTISSFCTAAPEARRLIEEFANYLRQSFDFKNPEMYVPLEKEISLIQSYVKIEKARFGDELNVVFELDAYGDVKIPALSIQPLVENAIRHGVRKKEDGGTVRVIIKHTREGLLVAVADDGPGIPSDILARILGTNSARTGDSRSVGLWNIDSRLRKLFGKGITVESEPGKGARVSFVIPEVN
jgi:two-component system sensor histidine kinase ChiS